MEAGEAEPIRVSDDEEPEEKDEFEPSELGLDAKTLETLREKGIVVSKEIVRTPFIRDMRADALVRMPDNVRLESVQIESIRSTRRDKRYGDSDNPVKLMVSQEACYFPKQTIPFDDRYTYTLFLTHWRERCVEAMAIGDKLSEKAYLNKVTFLERNEISGIFYRVILKKQNKTQSDKVKAFLLGHNLMPIDIYKIQEVYPILKHGTACKVCNKWRSWSEEPIADLPEVNLKHVILKKITNTWYRKQLARWTDPEYNRYIPTLYNQVLEIRDCEIESKIAMTTEKKCLIVGSRITRVFNAGERYTPEERDVLEGMKNNGTTT